jgi:hypothetical protein
MSSAPIVIRIELDDSDYGKRIKTIRKTTAESAEEIIDDFSKVDESVEKSSGSVLNLSNSMSVLSGSMGVVKDVAIVGFFAGLGKVSID